MEQRRRNARSFSGAWRRFDNQVVKTAQRLANSRKQAVDGKKSARFGYGFFSGGRFFSGVLDESPVSYLIVVSLLNCL